MKVNNIVAALLCGAMGLGMASCGSSSLNVEQLISAGLQATQAMTISDEQMAEYARQSVAQMDAQNKVLPSSNSYSKRLARLTANVPSVNGIPLNFKVYQTNEINAFACPDGSVRVYTGLMDVMDDNELLGVVGHEIGHVALHHSRDAFRQQLMNGAIGTALASAGGVVGALSQSQLAQLGNALASAKYSQKHELEADQYGYEFLQATGHNPWGIIDSFQKLDAMSDNSNSSYLANMFSSHPETATRIKKLTERARKEGIARPAK